MKKLISTQLWSFKHNQYYRWFCTYLQTCARGLGMALILIVAFENQQVLGQCTMVCNDNLHVTIPNTCEAEIRYDMILEDPDNPYICTPNGVWSYDVIVMQAPGGSPIPSSPVVTGDYIGQTLYVKVKHWVSGNSCWSTIFIEDKQKPTLSCPTDVVLNCTDSSDPSYTGFATATDCSDFTLTYTDNFIDLDCGLITARIERTWIATDAYNNFKSCVQNININKPHASQVIFPPDRDDNAAPAVSCVNADTSPESIGFPTIYGVPVTNGGVCNMVVSYEDQIITGCEGSYKILRDWTVVEWCSGTILEKTQLIKVEDNTPPVLTCPPSIAVGTDPFQDCSANVILPTISVSDACANTLTTSISSLFGSINGNGGLITDVPVGIHTLTYTSSDVCGNVGSCDVILTVTDDDAPNVICEDLTITTLNAEGFVSVFAETFDDGSFDNCCLELFEVRRMEDSNFGPMVTFTCDDLNTDVNVILRVNDCNGNSNECMVIVHIDDKTPPAISCPSEVTLNCQDDVTDVNLSGQPTAFDACGLGDINSSDQAFLNDCGIGFILRTYTVNDVFENGPSTCVQRINLIDNTPIYVTFPPDYTTSNCTDAAQLQPEDLPAPFNEPTAMGDDCELLAVNFVDEEFNIAPPACFKILRTWTVIDWCTYNPNYPDGPGRYTAVQVIKVLDNDAPTFTCPDDFTVDILSDNCLGTVTLPDVTDIVDCSDNTSVLISGDLGNGQVHNNVQQGVYDVTYSVFDGCGNSSSCDITVKVQDGKAPTPYCHAGLSITLMETAMVDVWAIDFNAGSFDNCTAQEDLVFTIGGESDENDNPPTTASLTFTCENLGTNTVSLWVTDQAGNAAFCETFVIIQDNSNVCTIVEPQNRMIAGVIRDEMGETVEDVTVTVSGSSVPALTTGLNGQFQFSTLLSGQDYTIIPEKDMNPKNGVTTFDQVLILKHIIGNERLDSPYKLIAADINNSGTITSQDMVEMRKLILNINQTFENNTSWRFVDATYEFLNPANPFTESFPEIYNVNNLEANMMDMDFVAIKVGDLNNSAIPNNFVTSDDRNTPETLYLEVDNEQLQAGQQYSIDVKAKNYQEILGFQFTLQFDPNALKFIDFQQGALNDLTTQHFGWTKLNEGFITHSYAKAFAQSINENVILFQLQFKAKTNVQLKEVLQLNSQHISAEAYHEQMGIMDVQLEYKATNKEINDDSATFALYQNHPNPFYHTTRIGFYLPEATSVRLSIFDISGKEIKAYKGEFPQGNNYFNLEKEELNRSGTLLYRLATPTHTASKRMILIE